MGCHVTSIYADQVIGKIYYPQQIITDLAKRDFCKSYKLQNKKQLFQLSKNIHSIYGFTQSYCQGFLFLTIIQQIEYLIYNSGRFVIKIPKIQLLAFKQENYQNNKMSILPHQDQICAMDVDQNMCAVGLSGGKLVLWDLKFNQVKIQIYLPKPSSSFSSISLTKKYIFVSDTSLPNNLVYCFDIQTTKLKASVVINSLQPTLKGIKFQQNHHVIISAQGLWFIRYSVSGNILQATKGMFTMYPKTSQCSITNVDDKYLVSGGVDGYIYVWNSSYQCIKVIRCYDQQQPITSLVYNKQMKTLIMGSFLAKIKCFTFNIKLKPKKNVMGSQGQTTQKEEDIQYLLTEAFQDDFGIQNLSISKQDKHLYFYLNHSGKMASNLLPSNQPYPSKVKLFKSSQLMRYSRKGQVTILDNHNRNMKKNKKLSKISNQQVEVRIKNVYPKGSKRFNIDLLKLSDNKKWWKIDKNYYIDTKQRSEKYLTFYSYCQQYNCIAYVDDEDYIVVNFMLNKSQSDNSMMDELKLKTTNSSITDSDKQALDICSIPNIRNLYGLNYMLVQIDNIRYNYLFVTYEDQCVVYYIKSKKEYIEHTSVKFIKEKFNNFTVNLQEHIEYRDNTITQIKNQQNNKFEVFYDYQLKIWKLFTEQKKALHLDKQQIINSQNNKSNQINQSNLVYNNNRQVEDQNNKLKQLNSINKQQIQVSQPKLDNQNQYLTKIHTASLKHNYSLQKQSKLTIGGNCLIIWKQLYINN